MGCMSPLSVIFLVYLCRIQGSSAATPVFVQTGKDLHLNVMKAVTLKKRDVFAWKFNGDSNVIRYFPDREPVISQSYSGRIDVTGENFSLKLKNPTKADSGVYTALIISDETVTVTEYNITVQDPVSPVKLRVDSASGSSDSCNVTVTCSSQDSHINSTFTCDTKTCSQEGGEQSEVTTSGASLHVYVTNYFIVCNHSNQVSWTEDRKKVEQFCTQQEDSEPLRITSITVSVVVSVIITLFVLIAVACYSLQKRRNSETVKMENTVYAVPQPTAMMQLLDQTPTVEDSINSPTSTYCLVEPHTRGKTIPESLYAPVQRPKS